MMLFTLLSLILLVIRQTTDMGILITIFYVTLHNNLKFNEDAYIISSKHFPMPLIRRPLKLCLLYAQTTLAESYFRKLECVAYYNLGLPDYINTIVIEVVIYELT